MVGGVVASTVGGGVGEEITTNAFGWNRPTPFDNILKSFVTRLNVMVVLEVIELGRAFSRTSEKEREWEKEIHRVGELFFSSLSSIVIIVVWWWDGITFFSVTLLWNLEFFRWRRKFCVIFHRLSSIFFGVFAIRKHSQFVRIFICVTCECTRSSSPISSHPFFHSFYARIWRLTWILCPQFESCEYNAICNVSFCNRLCWFDVNFLKIHQY